MSAPRADLRIGTCGFAGGQRRCFAAVDVVEVQKTFYQPPARATAERWRARAPAGLAFTVKAWQLISHARSSPTYRRLREPLGEEELDRAGGFRDNDVTRAAWERTREIADATAAEGVVLQTPRSFRPSPANLDRLRGFLGSIERDGRYLVFEPRGDDWTDEIVAAVCRELDLVHGVDPFLRHPVTGGLYYYRLHGRPAYNYRYTYTDVDLARLQAVLPAGRPGRVLFNNDAMLADAGRLRQRLGR